MTEYKIQEKILEKASKIESKLLLVSLASTLDVKTFNKIIVRGCLKINKPLFSEKMCKRIIVTEQA